MSREVRDIITAINGVAANQNQGAAVANLGASVNLSLTAPGAATLNATFSHTEVETALGLKADQSAVSTMMGIAETRLDNLEAKLNALLTSLRNSSQIAT